MGSQGLKQGNENSDLRKTLNKGNAITNPTNFQNKSNLPLNLNNGNNVSLNNIQGQGARQRTEIKTISPMPLSQVNPTQSNTVVSPNPNIKGSIGQNRIEISDRLKVMILLAISQQYNNENKIERVYLMEPKWLDLYNYTKIKKLVKSKFNEILKMKLTYDFNNLSKIIPILHFEYLDVLNISYGN